MIYVHIDDAIYSHWLESNPEGFVINLATSPNGKSKIHTAQCTHLQPFASAQPNHRTRRPKVCSADRAELEAWARKQGYRLAYCNSCGT